MITSYSGLLMELMRLIDGDDVSASSIPASTLSTIIGLGERRIYRKLLSQYNEKAWGLSVSGNAVTLPADFQGSSIVHFGKKPLEPVSEEYLLEHNAASPAGTPLLFAQAGNTLIFAPMVAEGTTLQGRYYCALPALDAATLPLNALFMANQDLFLYAALCESAPFFAQDARIPLWDAKYTDILAEINNSHQRAAYSAGRIKIRPSTRLMR